MFDNRYFKNKYVCRYGSGALSLMEVNGFRNEAYIYYSNDGKIDIYLRDFIKRPVKDDEFIMPVKTFFIEQDKGNWNVKKIFCRVGKPGAD